MRTSQDQVAVCQRDLRGLDVNARRAPSWLRTFRICLPVAATAAVAASAQGALERRERTRSPHAVRPEHNVITAQYNEAAGAGPRDAHNRVCRRKVHEQRGTGGGAGAGGGQRGAQALAGRRRRCGRRRESRAKRCARTRGQARGNGEGGGSGGVRGRVIAGGEWRRGRCGRRDGRREGEGRDVDVERVARPRKGTTGWSAAHPRGMAARRSVAERRERRAGKRGVHRHRVAATTLHSQGQRSLATALLGKRARWVLFTMVTAHSRILVQTDAHSTASCPCRAVYTDTSTTAGACGAAADPVARAGVVGSSRLSSGAPGAMLSSRKVNSVMTPA